MSERASGGSRARRSTARRVNYAKEQEFSDDDIFEDSADEETEKISRVRTKSSRKSKTADSDDEPQVYQNRVYYTEKGHDPSIPPIRERFPFLPEYEEDGSPKIDLIIGRRPVDEKEDHNTEKEEGEAFDDEDSPRKTRKQLQQQRNKNNNGSPNKTENAGGQVEYEYLVKYKGRSYLHLEWKTGADLESMNKSAKGIYRRWLKKLAQGTEEDLENPEFDPSYVIPEKIIDEKEQEMTVELTDKELLQLEKEREKELSEGDSDDEEEKVVSESKNDNKITMETAKVKEDTPVEDWTEDEIDYKSISIDRIRAIINRDGPYYAKVEGSNNPYRDGYVTEPPRKPRASYLFFQGAMRSFYAKKYPKAGQSELMSILGDVWRTLSDEERAPFIELAKEEAAQHEKESVLLEKAQKPNEVWQPLRRCRMVLERLAQDSFADIFLEPVDPEEFPDYDEIIDSPMDIGTIRENLEDRKYQAPEQFARDMRKVWNNCKIYNQHGSAIWHVADYMSKQFERLYHAWVLEFRERYLRWSDPRARPWEHSCRAHDGKCNTPDNEMVLCDHCDAMYGMKCLKTPLKKIPSKAWHCPDCKPKLKSVKGARMLSALAENAARKRAELGDLPKKTVKQTMFLVKWAGLGYEYCTWENREDINDDSLISRFRRLNNTFPDEADMKEDVVVQYLAETKHVNVENAGGVSCVPELRAQLYAQTRSFHFIKFGTDIPDAVCSACGPETTSTIYEQSAGENDGTKIYPRDVTECVAELVFQVARQEKASSLRHCTSLPPLMTGEYDAIVPITSKGLMMNVGEIHGSVAFLGYREFPDGSKGPAEVANLIRNVGDKIIAVDGISTVGKSFKDVIGMLRESGKNKFAFMRFLENRYAVCESELVSVGSKGRYTIEELQKKFTMDRQRVLVDRRQNIISGNNDDTNEVIEEDTNKGDDTDDGSDDGSEGEFQPESDDEELVVTGKAKEVSMPLEHAKLDVEGDGDLKMDPGSKAQFEVETDELLTTEQGLLDKKDNETIENDPLDGKRDKYLTLREETTRSLAYRLLDIDLGNSSDEGGDDECAYFVDGVDDTFTRLSELQSSTDPLLKRKVNIDQNEDITLPARQNEFSARGDRAKLAAAVCLTTSEPMLEKFESFPYQSMEHEEKERRAEEEAMDLDSPSKNAKRSTVKVEQANIETGEIIHIWANVESAAATLQIPLNDLRLVLRGEHEEVIGDELGGYRWRYALSGAKVTAGMGSSTRGGKKAKEAWLEFRDKLYDPNEPHIYKNGNRLRDYQIDGVNWLASTWYKRQGCILADEMGLGKTVQIVCYIEHLFRVEKIRRPYLVVVPLSTIEHWRREFEAWTDIACCIYHDRQRIWRDVLREYEWYYEDRPHTHEFLKFDVLVTTYDTLIGDFDVISQIPFRVAVVDEAHRLRNQKGKLLECMREISAKGTMQYGYQSRVLMSGTPLQNDLTELWTLLNFIEPFKFPDLDEFQINFGNMNNQQQVENLQRMISPFMLRRVKEDVAKDIPAKEETVIDVELTSIQKQYYRAIFEHNHAFLSIGGTRQNAPKLMNIQMELRKVCNHPYLLDGVEHRETERQFRELQEKGVLDGKSPEEQQGILNEHGYIMTSGKMVLLDKLLPKLRQEGHKILIFSQMVKMLDLISEYCEFRSFKYERLDGRVRGTERQKSIDRFERDPDSFIFLLSTRAGGVGINLTAADIVIIFDSDWNPQNDIQAQARCHRIGQTKDVRIYRLVTSRSFEQEMFDRASKKLGLEQAVLGTFEKEKDDDKPSQQEMEQLLKKGAYALLDDDNDEITKEFCADDIDAILAKRTRTRVVEGAKTSSWLNKAGMMVTKSKFTSETGTRLDMDDPLFWQKVMPDFVTPSIMMQKLNDLTDEIEGTTRKGRGRGRGRKKKVPEDEKKEDEKEAEVMQPVEHPGESVDEDVPKEEIVENNDEYEKANRGSGSDGEGVDALLSNETLDDLPDDDEDDDKNSKVQLSRTNIRKINKFMSDLKSMMENTLEDIDDEALSVEERNICQKLLLTISVKEKFFNEEQRRLARMFLKRLEGGRRRRCRTSESQRYIPGVEEEQASTIPEQLRITSKKRKKRRRRTREEIDLDDDDEPKRGRRKAESSGYLGEDGYLHHSDSEASWSDVAGDIYGANKKRETISRKEARRRRPWTADDDEATAAGRPWPAFPRHVVNKILTTVLDEVIKDDEENGGIFSVPVPKDEFPEYYEQIEKPMDYGTMRTKLESGEYRSAQAMQKDFITILQNCRQFNAPTSDIVKEARRQHLMRPAILKMAAMKHDLFLAEDGSVLEIVDDEKVGSKKLKNKKAKRGEEGGEEEIDDGEMRSGKKKKTRRKKRVGIEDHSDVFEADDGDLLDDKPRIKIKMRKPRKRKSENGEDAVARSDKVDVESDSAHNKKRKRLDTKEISKTKKNKVVKDSTKAQLVEAQANQPSVDEIPDEPDEEKSIYLNPTYWKNERKNLDGSFDAAKANFTSLGPWTLPEPIPDNLFEEVAKLTLEQMGKHDRYDVFAEAVSDKEAPGYSDVVKKPMDFGTMKEKVDGGKYGTGSHGAEALYRDFLLVFENCRAYNPDESDIAIEASRVLGYLPEAYATACSKVVKRHNLS